MQSAKALIDGIAQRLADAAADPAKLEQLRNDLDSNSSALAQAVNGGLHLKMYREDMPNARASIDDAYESGFVAEVIEPFEADSRQQAEEIVKARLAQVA